MEKLQKQISKGFGSHDISPAAMAYKMLRESKYVNESMLQYLVNYVIVMAEHPVIPVHLEEIHYTCKAIKDSLEELGLTGATRQQVVGTEYLAV